VGVSTNETISNDLAELDRDYQRIERAIVYLSGNFRAQPSLAEVASHVGLSEFHFQRLFGRWVGITPKRFLQFLTKEHAKALLAQSRSVLDAAYDAGLSGPSRLHDLLLSTEAVTPGEYRNAGEGLRIVWGVHPSPFGRCLVAATERGVCALRFVHVSGSTRSEADAVEWLARAWPRATLVPDPGETAALVSRIFAFSAGDPTPLHLHVRGTNFQIKVWEALLRVPAGAVVSYGDIARSIGAPRSTRAVGGAVGGNCILYLIPCHRVIREGGEFGDYRGGAARKKAILAWEAARSGDARVGEARAG